MIAYRSFLSGFLLLVCTVSPAWAQAPLVANRPPLPALANDLLDGSLTRGDAEPDTVAPWLYLPLEVGNAWEYETEYYFTSGPVIGYTRIDIPEDTLVSDQRHFIWDQRFYEEDGEASPDFRYRLAVRYDTLTARVVEPLDDGTGDRYFDWAPCQLDAAFGATAECFDGGLYAEVAGTYEGLLDFEPDTTVTGVAVKVYYVSPLYEDRFATGFGKAIRLLPKGGFLALRYARIGGEEFGTEQFPVASEGSPAPPGIAATLEVYPNPTLDDLNVVVALTQPEAVSIEVVDLLGRVVSRRDLRAQGPGEYTVRVDVGGLPGGVYFVRAQRMGPDGAVQAFTQKLTLVK